MRVLLTFYATLSYMNLRNFQFGALQFFVLSGLFAIASGLLYYAGQEQTYIRIAQAQVLPKQYLYAQASEHGLNYRLLNRIIECESGWRMVQNKASSAFGYFQILDKTERSTPQFNEGKRKTDPIANIDMGLYLYERYGTSPWNESRPCWEAAH